MGLDGQRNEAVAAIEAMVAGLADKAGKTIPPPALRVADAGPVLSRGGNGGLALSIADAACPATRAAAIAASTAPGEPVSADPETLALLALAERVAASDIPVLIDGPTGTGKEVLARFVHRRSPRASAPFIALNCAAMPEAMLEAMLFGHEKGAFTGAGAANPGFFRAADGGTLLLDEIAEMPVGLQAKLLRVLQEGEVTPIGATKAVSVDVRIVAAANRDLPAEVAAGRLREDLFFRLNVFPLTLAPLRERREDIAPLAFALMLRHTRGPGALPWIAESALEKLAAHSWPGNVRELENVVRRALLLVGDEKTICSRHVRFDRIASAPPVSSSLFEPRRLADVSRRSEEEEIVAALDACGGHRRDTAERLGISERTLRYRLAGMRDGGRLAAGAVR